MSTTPASERASFDRDEIVRRLKETEPRLRKLGVGALFLFGSYAREEANPDSDIDIFVDPSNEDFYALRRFVGAYSIIEDALPGHAIGYGTRSGLSRYVRAPVEAEAIQVF